MPSKRPLQRLHEIIEDIDLIAEYTAGMPEEKFSEDRKTVHATERCLMVISEAAIKLGPEAESLVPDMPWHNIRGLGNVLRHAYDQVSTQLLWEIITVDLPPLKKAIEKHL